MSDTIDMDVEESVSLSTQAQDVGTSCSSKGRRLRSLVWNDFTRVRQEDDGFVAICNHCQKVLSGGSQHGTTHLKKHLRICVSFQEASRGKSGDNEGFKFNQELSREKLTHMLIKHEYPFSMVEHSGFMDFVKSLQPQFRMFTRNTHKEDCIKLYDKEKDKMCKFFNDITFRVTLTADIWTSSNMVGYISLTCHFIDDDWRLQKKILNFLHFKYPHTGEEIYKTMKKLLVDWNLDKKLCSIVLDNALSNDKFVHELIDDLSLNRSLLLDGEFFRVRCCAHILNLVVQDGLKEISDELGKIRKIVRYIRSSAKKIQDFKKITVQEGVLPKGLILDVPTRWNSTYLMLERACEFQEIIRRFIFFDDDVHFTMSLEEWERVRIVKNCLELFYSITKRFSSVKSPTSNLYFNDLCLVYLQINNWLKHPHLFIVRMAEKMHAKFKKYWDMISMLLSIASVLDPRYKMKSMEYLYMEIFSNPLEVKEKIDAVHVSFEYLYNAYAEQEKKIPRSPHILNHACSSGSQDTNCGVGGVFELSSCAAVSNTLVGLSLFLQGHATNESTKSELEIYLERKVEVSTKDFDILQWWKDSQKEHPILSAMARDILAIPLSTVASESAFSAGGRVIDQYRSSLSPETVQALICTQDWLRAANKDDGLLTMSHAFEVDAEIEIDDMSIIPLDNEF